MTAKAHAVTAKAVAAVKAPRVRRKGERYQ
jgi:hypothetical protein